MRTIRPLIRPSLLLSAAFCALAPVTTALGASPEAASPAGGAAIGQVLVATAGASIATFVLLYLGFGHRSGRVALLGRVAGFAERVSGMPGWVALPSAVASSTLLIALFGMLWDISLHIADGRDAGPLANPAHYFILVGLFGIFAAGFLAMVLPKERPSSTAVRITSDWHAPLGGVLIAACGAFALIGFPLDDVWHRLFGQDVTLWGPTHLMLIGGAAMTLIGIAVLHVEGIRATGHRRNDRRETLFARIRTVALGGGLLMGLSVFQAEFDFGVPQFRFVLEPMMIAVAAGVALVAMRIWIGRGAALGAVAFFLVIRGGIAVIVGPVLGEPTPHFPLFAVEAVIVELVAWRVGTQRPLALGALAGALIGTVGLASEYAFSHVFSAIAWPADLIPEIVALAIPAAIAGGVLGAWVGAHLASDRLPRTRSVRIAAVAGAIVLMATVGYSLNAPGAENVTASITLTEVDPGSERTALATVRLDPPDAAKGAEWFTTIAWQGGGLEVDSLEQVGPGVYRTPKPIPLHGSWKTGIRLHRGNTLSLLPIYLPGDPAIPAAAVEAPAKFERAFVSDHTVLQREQKDVAAWLWPAGLLVVAAIAFSLLALIAWGLHRLALNATARPDPARRDERPAAADAPNGRDAPGTRAPRRPTLVS